MVFIYNELFWAMLIPFVIFAYLVARAQEGVVGHFKKGLLGKMIVDDALIPYALRRYLFLAGVALMIVALGRPAIPMASKKLPTQGLKLLCALDISGSMRSKDNYPSRLEFAKKKMGDFFDAMGQDAIGLLAFAYNPFRVAPFSEDKETLKFMLKSIDESYISRGSTDFGAMAEYAAEILQEQERKILVLFTDGGDSEQIASLKSTISEEGIDLYVVLVGSTKGAPVLTKRGNALRDRAHQVIITKRNDLLGRWAMKHKGGYVIAANGNQDIKKLAALIHSRYKNKKLSKLTIQTKQELFYYPLGLGLVLLLLSLSSLPRKKEEQS